MSISGLSPLGEGPNGPKIAIAAGARGVVTITLNRPDKSNALDAEMVDLLAAALAASGRDETARVIVLRGAGRHFCAGADVAPRPGVSSRTTIPEVCALLDALPKPTIAVVRGACMGGGLGLAACCDVLLATPDAFFAMPEVRLGIAPGPLALFFMRAMPARALRRYMSSGERFTAAQALAFGLVHEIRPVEEMESTLSEMIDAFLQAAPRAVADAKRIMRDYQSMPISEPTLRELQVDFERRAANPDAVEGRASFLEKRRPRWYC